MGVVEIRTEADMEQEVVGYEHDIRPLFREKDVSEMSWAFDLASYDDVRANADGILTRLSKGRCPATALGQRRRLSCFATGLMLAARPNRSRRQESRHHPSRPHHPLRHQQ